MLRYYIGKSTYIFLWKCVKITTFLWIFQKKLCLLPIFTKHQQEINNSFSHANKISQSITKINLDTSTLSELILESYMCTWETARHSKNHFSHPANLFHVHINETPLYLPSSPNQTAHLQSARCISYKLHLWECSAGHPGFLCTGYAGAEVNTKHG